MRRRGFIALLVGAAAAWPCAAHAQQTDRMHRVGVLLGFEENYRQPVLVAFQQQFQNLGWLDGRNVRIEYRWGGGAADRILLAAKEIVELHPDVILASTTPVVAALLRETRSIPIVFLSVTDPVSSGFAASLSRPQGNATGFIDHAPSLGGKWLELLKEIAPHISRVALVFNPETAPSGGLIFLPPFEVAARSYAVESIPAPVRNVAEIESVIAPLERAPGGALVVMSDVFGFAHRGEIISLASQYKLPAMYAYRASAIEGGLISYGVDSTEPYRHAASYVDRILRGAKPADLPVQQPTKFELVVNLKTAKALGLSVPPSLLARADEVIE
jgi:putative ABC transport system substrate-binding protein